MRVLESHVEPEILKVGLVVSRFNRHITEKLEKGALKILEQEGVNPTFLVYVSGAIEIPLMAKKLIEAGCNGIVALGCVIRGETSHYEAVCNTVERGCLSVQLEKGVPIGMGVLMTETSSQAFERTGGKKGHKGAEAANVTLEMIGLIQSIKDIKKTGEYEKK